MLRNIARLATVLFLLGMATAAFAQKTTVLRVVVVKTNNTAAYLQEIEKGRGILKKIGSEAQVRVWLARFAGAEAGSVIVSIQFPSMAAFAADAAKTDSNSEYQNWLRGLDKLRTIVSDSLYNEL